MRWSVDCRRCCLKHVFARKLIFSCAQGDLEAMNRSCAAVGFVKWHQAVKVARLHTLKVAQYHEDGYCFPLQLFPADSFSEVFFPRYKDFRNECLQRKKWSDYRFKSHLLLPWLHDMLVNNSCLKGYCSSTTGGRRCNLVNRLVCED